MAPSIDAVRELLAVRRRLNTFSQVSVRETAWRLTIQVEIQVEAWLADRSPKDCKREAIGVGAQTDRKHNGNVICCEVDHFELFNSTLIERLIARQVESPKTVLCPCIYSSLLSQTRRSRP